MCVNIIKTKKFYNFIIKLTKSVISYVEIRIYINPIISNSINRKINIC